MRGKEIPMVTWYKITSHGTESFKKPMYELQAAEVVKARQDALGKNVGWYFGTNCRKCHGVYPAFFTESGFEALGYYVCLVCGKESIHEPMPHIAARDWNADRYKWQPSGHEYVQMSIFDFMKGAAT